MLNAADITAVIARTCLFHDPEIVHEENISQNQSKKKKIYKTCLIQVCDWFVYLPGLSTRNCNFSGCKSSCFNILKLLLTLFERKAIDLQNIWHGFEHLNDK